MTELKLLLVFTENYNIFLNFSQAQVLVYAAAVWPKGKTRTGNYFESAWLISFHYQVSHFFPTLKNILCELETDARISQDPQCSVLLHSPVLLVLSSPGRLPSSSSCRLFNRSLVSNKSGFKKKKKKINESKRNEVKPDQLA